MKNANAKEVKTKMNTKVTKKPASLVATGYRSTSNYSKLVAKADALAAKKGTYSQSELVALCAMCFSHRKVSGKRTKRQAWQHDFYVVSNPNHKSNRNKTRWKGAKDNGKLVLCTAEATA